MNVEQLESRIKTYYMMHYSLLSKGINDTNYLNQALQAEYELEQMTRRVA